MGEIVIKIVEKISDEKMRIIIGVSGIDSQDTDIILDVHQIDSLIHFMKVASENK